MTSEETARKHKAQGGIQEKERENRNTKKSGVVLITKHLSTQNELYVCVNIVDLEYLNRPVPQTDKEQVGGGIKKQSVDQTIKRIMEGGETKEGKQWEE